MPRGCHLILEGTVKGQCTCGDWVCMGLPPEARDAIRKLFEYHLRVPPPKAKKKNKK
jgi:hypothetical protein